MDEEELKNGDIVGLDIPGDGIREPRVYQIGPCPFTTIARVNSVIPPVPAGMHRIKVNRAEAGVIEAVLLDTQGALVEIRTK